jgi:hypothetical protein
MVNINKECGVKGGVINSLSCFVKLIDDILLTINTINYSFFIDP